MDLNISYFNQGLIWQHWSYHFHQLSFSSLMPNFLFMMKQKNIRDSIAQSPKKPDGFIKKLGNNVSIEHFNHSFQIGVVHKFSYLVGTMSGFLIIYAFKYEPTLKLAMNYEFCKETSRKWIVDANQSPKMNEWFVHI